MKKKKEKLPTIRFNGDKGFGLSYRKGKDKALIIQCLDIQQKAGEKIIQDNIRRNLFMLQFSSDKSIEVTIEALTDLLNAEKISNK